MVAPIGRIRMQASPATAFIIYYFFFILFIGLLLKYALFQY